jgi:hypothetical protein
MKLEGMFFDTPVALSAEAEELLGIFIFLNAFRYWTNGKTA